MLEVSVTENDRSFTDLNDRSLLLPQIIYLETCSLFIVAYLETVYMHAPCHNLCSVLEETKP
jgi:hypothetical protein